MLEKRKLSIYYGNFKDSSEKKIFIGKIFFQTAAKKFFGVSGGCRMSRGARMCQKTPQFL